VSRASADGGAQLDAALEAAERGQVTTDDGWTLGTRHWSHPKARANLLLTPAMGASTRSMAPLARAIATRAVNVLLGDPRGVGLSLPRPQRGLDFGIEDHLTQDWPTLIAATEALGQGLPLFIGGHSLGGQLSALYCGRSPGHAAGLITLAACVHDLRYWPLWARPGLWSFYRSFALIASGCGYLPGHRLGWGRPCSRSVTKAWAGMGLHGDYQQPDGSPFAPTLAAYRGAALIVSFSDDTTYCPRAASDALAQRLHGARLERWHRDPEEFGAKRFGHFGWRGNPDLGLAIADWIEAKLPPRP
jgi:predicted alpha/beta hydrolase